MSGKISNSIGSGSGQVSGDLESVGNFVGMIQSFGATASGTHGWLLCDGTSYNRVDYPSLFAAISTTWGSASGSTFNVPNLNAAFLRMRGSHTSQMGNTNVFQGGNLGTMSNDQVQDYRHSYPSNLIKVGGPDTGWGFIGRTIGNHGMSYRTGVFYYDHTQGGNSPYSSTWANWNSAMTDNGGTGTNSGGTRRTGGESKPFSATVQYNIYAGVKGS
jgi:hypothetical protein